MKSQSRCKSCDNSGFILHWMNGRSYFRRCEACARRRLVRLVFAAICIAGAILGLLLRGVP